jgi:hypothetical protein
VKDLPENSSASVRKFPSLPGTGLGEQINEQKAKAIGIKAFLMKPSNNVQGFSPACRCHCSGLASSHTKFYISAAAGQKNGQSDQNRNFDVTLLATKSPRHQEYIEILSSCLRAFVAKL